MNLACMHQIYEKDIKKQGEYQRASSWCANGNCCEATARATVHRGCIVGGVGDGAADREGEAEWENVVLSPPRTDGVAARDAKVRARGH